MPKADIVFCLDASGSMQPTFEGVKHRISTLLDTFNLDLQRSWDVRLDFFAYHDIEDGGQYYSVREGIPHNYLYHSDVAEREAHFFTHDMKEFTTALDRVGTLGEEAQLRALDTALDYPWRKDSYCHRVIVFMTDETLTTGVAVEQQIDGLEKVMNKIERKNVVLFMVAPKCRYFARLSTLQNVIYEVQEESNNGLSNINFTELMVRIGKSISSKTVRPEADVDNEPAATYGQDEWAHYEAELEFRSDS